MPGNELKVYVNGAFLPASEAKVSVFDHSFLYGDGIFEGIRVDKGKIFKLDEHIDRLFRSAQFIHLAIPLTFKEMRDAVIATVAINRLSDGYLRPLVTRGEGLLGIEATKSLGHPNVFVIPQVRRKFDDSVRMEKGLRAKVLSIRRIAPQSLDPRIKSNNYLNNILGKFEQWAAQADVGIMLDSEGWVTEGCSENIFCVSRGVLFTPPAFRTLDGITRQTVLHELCPALKLEAKEKDLTTYDLYTADEAFVTGTLTEVVPIVEIDGRRLGNGKPGPISLRILSALRELMARSGTPAFERASAF
jgi:branched-chain amino acid aminotransferase